MANKLITLGKDIIKASATGITKSMIGAIEYEGNYGGGTFTGVTIGAEDYRGGGPGMWMFGNNGFSYQFKYNGHGDAQKAYTDCSPFTAIINKKAKSYTNGKTWILNSQGKESASPEAKAIKKLMKKPNAVQSWKQFEAQQEIYVQVFGFCLTIAIFPFGYGNDGPIDASALWNIPPFMLDIKETNKLFYQTDITGIIQSIVLNYKNVKTTLDLKNVYIFKDISPSFESIVFPESRVGALEMQIANIMAAYESRNVLINRRGAMGILSNQGKDPLGTIAIDANEKRILQDGFSSYGLKRDQWQVIVTNAALQWQQMGYPTRDLMLFEEIDDDIMRICDAYDFPYRLLSTDRNNSLGGTDANLFLKNLYQDAIIPEAESMYEQWNRFFRTEDYNIDIQKDFSHIPCLQEDRLNQGRARLAFNQAQLIEWQNDLITRNQWLQENGLDPIGPEGDLRISEAKAAGLIATAPAPGLPNSTNQNDNNADQGNQDGTGAANNDDGQADSTDGGESQAAQGS
jgi:hypothetical protein